MKSGKRKRMITELPSCDGKSFVPSYLFGAVLSHASKQEESRRNADLLTSKLNLLKPDDSEAGRLKDLTLFKAPNITKSTAKPAVVLEAHEMGEGLGTSTENVKSESLQ